MHVPPDTLQADEQHQPLTYREFHEAEVSIAQPFDTQRDAMPYIAGERREVTVVCVDFATNTAADDTLQSSNSLVIDQAIRRAVEIVYSYEGTIDHFTQCGFMALYGVPTLHENDPERAARAALEIHRALNDLKLNHRAHAEGLVHSIVIHTGHITVSSLADNLHVEYLADQTTIDTPLRLQALATPNTIAVSHTTYQYTHLNLSYEPLLHSPEYNSRHNPVFRLTGVGPRTKRNFVQQAPMFGRDQHLAQLYQAFQRVISQNQSEIVFLSGEAGIGKSRLLVEFIQSLSVSTVQVYQGACLAHARSQSLWVVIDLLRNLLGIAEDTSIAGQRAAVQAYIHRMGLASDEVTPYLHNVLNIPQPDPTSERRLRFLDPAMLQRQVHTVVRQLLAAEARKAPTVLIFEDLQWVDPASRDFLEYLVSSVSAESLMVVLVARDEAQVDLLGSPLHVLAPLPQYCLKLQLQALNDDDAAAFVAQLVPETSDIFTSVCTQLVQRTQGNPLYIEEAVRMLIDQQAIVQVGNEWLVTGRVMSVLGEVPGTVQALVLARFDHLPESLRRTLQKAAICGIHFPGELLALLGDVSSESVAAQLSELELHQFLTSHGGTAEHSYQFRHTMLHEAIYQTVLIGDRQNLHEQVAQALLVRSFWSADEQTEALAYHYAASANPAKAVPFLVTSAENAARRYANQTVIERYRQAMMLMTEHALLDSDLCFQIKLGLGRGLKFVGQFAEARQVLFEALGQLQQASPSAFTNRTIIEVLRELAEVRQREGALEEAVELLEQGLEVIVTANMETVTQQWQELVERKAFIRFRQGKLDEALVLASSVADNLDPQTIDDPATIASLYNTLGGICWQQGELSKAISYVEHSLELYESLSYSFGIANVLTNLGILHYTGGAWSKALDCLQRSDTLRQEIGYMVNRAHSIRNLGMLRMAMGNHTGARRDLETSLAVSQRVNDDYEIIRGLLGLAHLAVVQSRYPDARTQLNLVAERLDAAGEEELVMMKWLLGLVEAETGDLVKGQATVSEALQLARLHGLAEQESECQRVLGILFCQSADYAEAERLLRDSANQCRERTDPYQEGLALLELGRLYSRLVGAEPGNNVLWRRQAVAVLDAAKQHFVSLGASFDLATANTLRAALL